MTGQPLDQCSRYACASAGYEFFMATMANRSFCPRDGFEVKPQALDCGESFCLAEPIEKIEQGLRGQRDFS